MRTPLERERLFLVLLVSDFMNSLLSRSTGSSLKYGVDLCTTDP